MDTTRKRAKRLAEFAYPDVNPAHYPSKEEYIKEKLKLIDLRVGFVRGYLARRRPEVRYAKQWLYNRTSGYQDCTVELNNNNEIQKNLSKNK